MTTRQKALAKMDALGLGHEIHPPSDHGRTPRMIEVLAPDGMLFDDGGEGLTGLMCDSWADVLTRIEAGEAATMPEVVA